MKRSYALRQALLFANQALVIACFCAMQTFGDPITNAKGVHLFLITLAFCDAAYISYKNMQNNSSLQHFSYLLLLSGWTFLLSLCSENALCAAISTVLIPITMYQAVYFVQLFLFQATAYQYQKQIIALLRIACMGTVVSFFISPRLFAIGFLLQCLVSLCLITAVAVMNHTRVGFVLQTHKKELLLSFCFIVVPFVLYVAFFYNSAAYLENLGSYLITILTFASIHRIALKPGNDQSQPARLNKKSWLVFALGIIVLFGSIAHCFDLSILVVFALVHSIALLVQAYNLLVFWQIQKQSKQGNQPANPHLFYESSLALITREETLKKDFSNYLHDDILQNLLSIKNLTSKADQPEIQALITQTLDDLNQSIRSQMHQYHSRLLKSATLKENIQMLLDMLKETHQRTFCNVELECADTVFLVEPYTEIVYRMIKELTANALKHSKASHIRVVLTQHNGVIELTVSDNGVGFAPQKRAQGHHGLNSINEQVSLLDGTILIESAVGKGTSVAINLPMKGGTSYESFVNR